MSLHVPSLIMGSIVNVCPGLITPIALFSGGRERGTERERESSCKFKNLMLLQLTRIVWYIGKGVKEPERVKRTKISKN